MRHWNRKKTSASRRLAGLDAARIEAIGQLAGKDGADRLPVIEKLDKTLRRTTGEGIGKGHGLGQRACSLVKLRDAFVHFRPERQWDNEAHRLEKMLKPVVPQNPLLPGASPWFPHHALSAGVAQWACDVADGLIADWEERIGLTNRVELDGALIIVEGN
ncbi:hypothetical protein KL864_23050 [Mycolicibacterium goodii]|uniref:hypothetical protein n=1 Tax=Mycolicibacterium goodii TaxID=134601 RepID=UPI001BDDBA0B|nr:hypothetical protein [Mycolicibacterium goodii]MBU8818775.1 hypothetical protein [Mycolicibacterium goodii]